MLRIEIQQTTAHFRIPTIGGVFLSYPLPPPSTIFGFLRHITENPKINYRNTKLSIQGYFEQYSISFNKYYLQTVTESKTNIINTQELHNCHWIIHVISPYEKEILQAIQSGDKIRRLGRSEDIIRCIEATEITETENNYLYNTNGINTYMYIPLKENNEIKGIVLRIPIDIDFSKSIKQYKFMNALYAVDSKVELYCNPIFDGKYIIKFLDMNDDTE